MSPAREPSEGPHLTWAQENYWYIYAVPLPTIDSVKLGPRFPVAPATLEQVTRAVGDLAQAFESLRTVYPVAADGVPRQHILPAEPADLTVVAYQDEDTAQQLIDRLAAAPMDPTVDRPLRAGVVMRDGAPQELVLLMNHIACDAGSTQILRTALAALLASDAEAFRELVENAQQPAEQGAALRSPHMQQYHARAVEHWRSQYRSAPGVVFPRFRPLANGFERSSAADTTGTAQGTYLKCRLTVPSLQPAIARLAARESVGAATLINAAVGIGLAGLSGNARTAMQLNASNRDRHTATSVGCFFQPTLLILDLDTPTPLGEALRQVSTRSLAAHRYARYSYFAVREERSRIASDRGVDFRIAVTVDCRVAAGSGASPAAPDDVPPAEPTFAVLDCDWLDDYNDFYLVVSESGTSILFDLVLHRSLGSAATAERLLRALSGLLSHWDADASWGERTVGQARAAFDFATTDYPEGWIYADHCWVNGTRLLEAARAMPGVVDARLALADGDERGVLALTLDAECSQCVTVDDVRHRLWLLRSDHTDVVVPPVITVRAPIESAHSCPPPAADDDLRAARAALCEAIAPGRRLELDEWGRSYVELGGTTAGTRRAVETLTAAGFKGLTPEDLLSPLPASVLVTKLVPDAAVGAHDS